jgi:hypothetical protein
VEVVPMSKHSAATASRQAAELMRQNRHARVMKRSLFGGFVKTQSCPTRCDPERLSVIPTRNDPEQAN